MSFFWHKNVITSRAEVELTRYKSHTRMQRQTAAGTYTPLCTHTHTYTEPPLKTPTQIPKRPHAQNNETLQEFHGHNQVPATPQCTCGGNVSYLNVAGLEKVCTALKLD